MTLEVRTEALGGGAVARLALSGGAPAEWYPPAPSTAEGWRARARQVHAEFADGADGEWLRALEPALRAGGPAADRLARCARDGGVVVTTGQQPGLFGGPIYTWSKALSALTLADALQQATGVATAPVFWAATDDTDFAEASWTRVAVPGGVETLQLSEPGVDGIPLSRVPLQPEISVLAERLARGVGSAAYPHALDVARRAYQPGRTLGDAYVSLLRGVLEPLGIAVLDASDPSVGMAAFPTLARALEQASVIEAALAERRRALAAHGLSPQVPTVEGLSLVFASGGGGKQRVPVRRALAAARESHPGQLAPNVLLRPVVERRLLPTVAYTAGPGELAYFAQVSAVAAALGLPAPLAVPRWSGTILEPHVMRLLRRYGIEPDELRSPHAVEGRLARAALPPVVIRAFEDARQAADRLAAELAGADASILVPLAAVDGARRGLLDRIRRLERRYVAAAKRRESQMVFDVATARGALFPGGVRQERALNFVPLLTRHGPALLDAMRQRAAEHAAALVGAGASSGGAPLARAR